MFIFFSSIFAYTRHHGRKLPGEERALFQREAVMVREAPGRGHRDPGVGQRRKEFFRIADAREGQDLGAHQGGNRLRIGH